MDEQTKVFVGAKFTKGVINSPDVANERITLERVGAFPVKMTSAVPVKTARISERR